MRKESQQQKENILRKVVECQDIQLDAQISGYCRKIYQNIEQVDSKKCDFRQIEFLLEDVLTALRQDQISLAVVCLERILVLSKEKYSNRSVGRMGLFDKIKAKFGVGEEKSQSAILQKEVEETENTVFELQKKIAILYDKYTSISTQIEKKAQECARLPKNSTEYSRVRQQAIMLQMQLTSITQQLNMYTKALENNTKYQAMIQTGQSTFDLKKYVPNTNRAEAIMDKIAEEMEGMAEELNDFAGELSGHENRILQASSIEAFSGHDEFDDMINMYSDMDNVQTKIEEVHIAEEAGIKENGYEVSKKPGSEEMA